MSGGPNLNTDPPNGFNIEGTLWKHLKTGNTYEVLMHGFIEATQECVVIYKRVGQNFAWVRPYKEFMDGRFEQIDKTIRLGE